MKKFLLSVAALALFAAPSFAQLEQEVTCDFYGSYSAKDYPDKVWDMGGQEVEGINYDASQIQPITSVLTKDGDNTYTLHNAFGSDNSITFSFNPAEADEEGWAKLTYAEPGNYDDTHIKFQGSDYRMWSLDGNRWKVKGNDGKDYDMNDICFRFELPTPMVKVEDGWYEVYIYIWAEYNNGDWGWLTDHWMIFTIDEESWKDAAVAAVEVDENAPVEYYNLQGVKVANPSNGVYIVRQGKNVKKVMVK